MGSSPHEVTTITMCDALWRASYEYFTTSFSDKSGTLDKARFEPAKFCSTHKSPNYYTPPLLSLRPITIFPLKFHRQTLETNPANHWQPISNPPSPSHPYRIAVLLYYAVWWVIFVGCYFIYFLSFECNELDIK